MRVNNPSRGGRNIRNNYERYRNVLSTTRNRYPRPTTPYVQFEEREAGIQAAYTPDTLYEWNIDGLSECEILNVLHEMLMVSNVYKTIGRTDHYVANCLVTGFTGQLKGWWNNTLIKSDKAWIKAAYTRDNDSNFI
jgi:hypothetical protein